MVSLITFARVMNDAMEHLSYYKQLVADLKITDPANAEQLEEEVRIIIHKLKFIPIESRPLVEFVYPKTENQPDQRYLEELLDLAGAQVNPLIHVPEHISILIFVEKSPEFLSRLPEIIAKDYQDYQAVKNNQVFVLTKHPFAHLPSDYLIDSEILAEIIQSKYFIFGHEGNHWFKFDLQA